jgi:hypothetical protein
MKLGVPRLVVESQYHCPKTNQPTKDARRAIYCPRVHSGRDRTRRQIRFRPSVWRKACSLSKAGLIERTMRNLSETVELLQNVLIDRATGGSPDAMEYQRLRQEIVNDPQLKDLAPRFLRTCRSPDQFWQFIKYEISGYAARRQFIWNEFRPMLERLEGSKTTPADSTVSTALEIFDPDNVQRLWVKALERRETDPEGAITVARTLLETVCKHILDERDVQYEAESDLPALYKTVGKTLNLAPSQHSEPIFKQILGSCTAVVEGLGAMRNRLSDAHGLGKKQIRPAPRHAELAVNLAGAMAVFLVSTHQARVNPT